MLIKLSIMRQLANGHDGEDREEAFREAVDIPGVDLEKIGEYRAKHLAS